METMIRLLVILGTLLVLPGCDENSTPPTSPQRVPTPPPAPTPEPDAGPGPVPPEIAAWVEANALPFDGTHLSLPHTDIEFLHDLVGDARIVALGENTHGTRDFFEMKARILRFLVEEMGFNTFAIEATWPESRLVDHYVRTGEGDPARLLAGLYFWTWNTESVIEMIEWMRSHNEAGGDVGFHGFDMQHPGMALHNVRDYVRQVDAESVDTVGRQLDCLARFANGPDGWGGRGRPYPQQSATYWADCRTSLDAARDLLLEHREDYESASGEDAFAVALQSLRVALQYHLQTTGEQYRDESMAENTEWINRRIGPEGRMVLWAHNYHVSNQRYAQGSYLKESFGDDMLVLAFTHERGSFTAYSRNAQRNQAWELDPPVAESVEHYLSAASAPQFILDLREVDGNTAGGSWLTEPRQTRHIGCCYEQDEPEAYWDLSRMTALYDVLAHFESTEATTVLPFDLSVFETGGIGGR
jgi:erythromycin esterase